MRCKVSCVYFVHCVSRILFGMSLAMDVRCATYSLRLAVNHVKGFVLCLHVRTGGWWHRFVVHYSISYVDGIFVYIRLPK